MADDSPPRDDFSARIVFGPSACVREADMSGAADVGEQSRVFRALVSTENPLRRSLFYGGRERAVDEILEHGGGAPNLTRFDTLAGIPVLRNHDFNFALGKVRRLELEADRLFAEIEIFGDTSAGREVISQLQNRYSTGISAGYKIRKYDLTETDEVVDATRQKLIQLRVRSWEVMEISVTPVPADPVTGVFRDARAGTIFLDSDTSDDRRSESHHAGNRGGRDMEDENKNGAGGTPPKDEKPSPDTHTRAAPKDEKPSEIHTRAATKDEKLPPTGEVVVSAAAAPAFDVDAHARAVNKRSGELQDEALQIRHAQATAIRGNFTEAPREVRNEIDARLVELTQRHGDTALAASTDCNKIVSRALSAQSKGNAQLSVDNKIHPIDFVHAAVGDPRGAEARAFSKEEMRDGRNFSSKMQDEMVNRDERVLAPYDLLFGRAAFTSEDTTGVAGATAGAGNADKNTQYGVYRPDLYVEALRPDLKVSALGIRRMTTTDDFIYAIQGAVGQAEFVGETGKATESMWTNTQRRTTPHRYTMRMNWSGLREMQDRNPLAPLISRELLRGTAQAYENAIINGDGTGNMPRGIFGTVGLGAATFGSDINTGGAISKAGLLALERSHAEANLPGPYRILTTPGVGIAAQQIAFGALNAPSDATLVNRPLASADHLMHYPYVSSNLMPSNEGKGSTVNGLHTLVFGAFDEIVVVDYGAVEIVYDSLSYAANNMRQIVFNAWMDVTILRPTALTAVSDIIV